MIVTREGGAAAPQPARPLPAPASEAELPELSPELLASLAHEMREVGTPGGAPHARLHGHRQRGGAGHCAPRCHSSLTAARLVSGLMGRPCSAPSVLMRPTAWPLLRRKPNTSRHVDRLPLSAAAQRVFQRAG